MTARPRGELVLRLATIATLVICGAGSYDHAVLVTAWTANPPDSIAMFHGPYALDMGAWWTKIHGPTLLLMIAALALLWGQTRRRHVAAALVIYAHVLVVTLAWFVPELLTLTTDPNAGIPLAEWKARADRWELWSLVRLAVMYGVAALLLRAVAEPSTPRAAS
ncbi:MAG: hypothetical protein KC636_02005 [Myxococcales bacterium]|nr:hypothetical protein [Myxococcales bacterium]